MEERVLRRECGGECGGESVWRLYGGESVDESIEERVWRREC